MLYHAAQTCLRSALASCLASSGVCCGLALRCLQGRSAAAAACQLATWIAGSLCSRVKGGFGINHGIQLPTPTPLLTRGAVPCRSAKARCWQQLCLTMADSSQRVVGRALSIFGMPGPGSISRHVPPKSACRPCALLCRAVFCWQGVLWCRLISATWPHIADNHAAACSTASQHTVSPRGWLACSPQGWLACNNAL